MGKISKNREFLECRRTIENYRNRLLNIFFKFVCETAEKEISYSNSSQKLYISTLNWSKSKLFPSRFSGQEPAFNFSKISAASTHSMTL